MPRVTHFSIQADDLDRAEAFYRDRPGWEFAVREGPEPIRTIRTGPPTAYACTVGVTDDPENHVHRVRVLGGDIVSPRTAIAGVGWVAALKDTEGNSFDVMRRDRDAR